MSAALKSTEARDLEAILRPYALMAGPMTSPELIGLLRLVDKLKRLRHCDGCGVLFEGLPNADECWHCQEDRRRGEAMEARGGGL